MKRQPQSRKKQRYDKETGEPIETKWCSYKGHWRSITEFSRNRAWCYDCRNKSKKEMEQGTVIAKRVQQRVVKVIDPLFEEFRATQQILFDVLTCEFCQSRGYIINHENKLFICDCRRKAKMQIQKLKEKK